MKQLFLMTALFLGLSAYGQVDTVDIGSAANDGTGDNLRVAFGRSNTADLLLEDRLDSITNSNLSVGLATLATTVTVTDNESTAENNPLVFVAGGDLDGGSLGLETDGTTYYTPSTGVITATGFTGTLTGSASSNVKLQADIVELFSLNVGFAQTSSDSIYFDNDMFYAGAYNSADTLYVTQLVCAVAIGDELSGTTTISVDLDWDVNMNDGTQTSLNSSPLVVTSTTTGTVDASFDNAVIDPATWVWWRVTATEGRIPSKLVCTASGYVAD